MRRTFLFMATLLITSTLFPVAHCRPSNNAAPTGLAYYISVVKKQFQGKPLTRKEAQTLSSLKKWAVISLAAAGTLGTTGLYRLYMGRTASNGDAAVEDESVSAKAMPDTAAEGEEKTDWDDDPEYVYEPSADEEQQLQEKLAPKLAPLLADEPDDSEDLPPERPPGTDAHLRMLGAAFRVRRGDMTVSENKRKMGKNRRQPLEADTFDPEESEAPEQ